MKKIAIRDITKSTFDELTTRLPILPAGCGSFDCRNPHMLMIWKDRFERFYGLEGYLLLDWDVNTQIEDNDKYDKACNVTADAIFRFEK